ncbi:MAG: hypothetical protein NTY83_01785, partial [Candidatus Micrarchaeota archaeon]|nr:hypothetical protein [Candidatus Micrarchaeota archaeon]
MAGQAVKTHKGQAIRFPVASSQLPASGNPKLETGTRRGQASIEMLSTVGVVLLLLLPLLM